MTNRLLFARVTKQFRETGSQVVALIKTDCALGVPLLYGSLNMTARKISRLPIGSILSSVIAPNDTSVEI
jgi:hypothetical protein